MVSNRCKMAVKEVLKEMKLHFMVVDLGEVEIMEDLSSEQLEQLKSALVISGLELMDNKKSVLIQQIKTVIIELVHYSEEPLSVNLSEYLSQQLHHNYTYMANVFSEAEGHSIERFAIDHKIERVKELLVYDELTLTEIAYKMHYCSVAHLSSQFKKVTGQTTTHYKRLQSHNRVLLETI